MFGTGGIVPGTGMTTSGSGESNELRGSVRHFPVPNQVLIDKKACQRVRSLTTSPMAGGVRNLIFLETSEDLQNLSYCCEILAQVLYKQGVSGHKDHQRKKMFSQFSSQMIRRPSTRRVHPHKAQKKFPTNIHQLIQKHFVIPFKTPATLRDPLLLVLVGNTPILAGQ